MEIAWKIIAGLAALFLAVAAYFGFTAKGELKTEQLALKTAEETKLKANSVHGKALRYLDRMEGYRDQYGVERDDFDKQTRDTEADTAEVKADTASMQSQTQLVQTDIETIEKKLVDYKDIDALIADATNLKAESEAVNATLANRQQRMDLLTGNISQTKTTNGEYRELVARQRGAELDTSYKARVVEYHPDWEFVVLDRGNLAETYANAKLDVQRGGQSIGQVLINNVEQRRSAATILRDTFAPGVAPQVGDLLIPTVAVAEGAEGLPGEDTTAAGPGASDILPPPTGGVASPFEAMGAIPDSAPASADPFGLPSSDSAPAPADPFGAMGNDPAPAPAGDAPAPAGDDPFGPVNPAGGSADPFAN